MREKRFPQKNLHRIFYLFVVVVVVGFARH